MFAVPGSGQVATSIALFCAFWLAAALALLVPPLAPAPFVLVLLCLAVPLRGLLAPLLHRWWRPPPS